MADDVTQLLSALSSGHGSAVDRLLPLVYDELRRLAQDYLQHERPGHTLQATALVHEAYLKLVDQSAAQWKDRAHFMAVAAQAMRRILVDHARTRRRHKRGGGLQPVSADTAIILAYEQSVDLVSLDDALSKLESISPPAARVVEIRYFGGLTIAEAAAVLDWSESSVECEWRYARAWLFQMLGPDDSSLPAASDALAPVSERTAQPSAADRTQPHGGDPHVDDPRPARG